MAENDSIIIKPVESLQNIAGLTPAGRRENKKRRQQLKRENEQGSEAESQLNETMDVLILCTTQSDLEGIIESHKILLDHMNEEVPKLIVECVDKFS